MILDKEEKKVTNNELQELFRVGVITTSKQEDYEFITGIFACQNIDETYNMILILKKLIKNCGIQKKKNKKKTKKNNQKKKTKQCIGNMKFGSKSREKNEVMASIDHNISAYYCVPIAWEDRKYLKFLRKEQLYENTFYSNGLTELPRCYAKSQSQSMHYHTHWAYFERLSSLLSTMTASKLLQLCYC